MRAVVNNTMPEQFNINDISSLNRAVSAVCSVHLSHSTLDLLTECAGQAGLEHLAQNLRVFLSNPRGHFLHCSWSLSSCFGLSRVQL